MPPYSTPTTGPRPGLILVYSRPVPPFTPEALTKWYDETHIPDVLATPGIHAAARYQLRHTPDRNVERVENDGEMKGRREAMPYLAMYHLKDLEWLHSDGCEFWKLGLEVEDEGRKRSVFEAGEFEMEFWEVVDSGTQKQGLLGGGEGPATHLVLGYLNAKEVNERGGETLLSATLPSWASKMRSTLFRVDETRPGPPSIKEDGEEDGVRPGEKKHLCLHEIFGSEIETAVVGHHDNFHYTLLRSLDGS